MRGIWTRLGVTGLCLGLAAPVAAATVWDEAVAGDLSTDETTPTSISLDPGSNEVFGSVQSLDDTRDYLTFTIAEGQQLEALNLIYLENDSGGPGNRIFHAINAGETGIVPLVTTADLFLGGDHIDPDPAGTDLLPGLGAATANGTGFDIPLGPGAYTYVVQQVATQPTLYGLAFIVGVPEPSGAALVALGLVALAARMRPGRRG